MFLKTSKDSIYSVRLARLSLWVKMDPAIGHATVCWTEAVFTNCEQRQVHFQENQVRVCGKYFRRKNDLYFVFQRVEEDTHGCRGMC